MYGPPFVPLAVAATVTTHIQLATGIAIGLTRSPFETAMAALDLDHLSQGRFILGLGTGPVHFTKGYYGMPYDKPVSRLQKSCRFCGVEEEREPAKWLGRPCYQLEFHGYNPAHHTVNGSRWIAALRQRMCELAGKSPTGSLAIRYGPWNGRSDKLSDPWLSAQLVQDATQHRFTFSPG